MFATLNINKRTLALFILLAGLLISLSAMQVRAAANDSSITLKKDSATGLFTLTVKDPDGIQEFSLAPNGKLPYGGGMSGCSKTFSIDNTIFDAPRDFEPVMPAYVIDCRNNTANLEIAPPKDGLAKSVFSVKEAVSLAPQPLPKEEPKKEKKGGPLSAEDIRYPVPELGNCQSEKECRSYCDNSQNAKECFSFAKKYNLITEKEANEEKEKFLSVNNGPGGCSSGVACEAYCNNVGHLDECISFAEKSGYYSGDELAEARKFQALVKSGKSFPGGCKDRNTCELYCNDGRHMEECLNFAEETGFMPKEEIEQARKILPLMQRGETPGGCTSKEQCEKYCFADEHALECVAFGEKAGLISAEDAAMVKKTGGKGPGGCRSKEQCDAYCENNSDQCFQWAQDNGFFNETDLAKMKKGMAQFKEQLDKIPPEVTQCLKDVAGEKNFNKLINGEPVFDRNLEGKMKSCFSQLTSQVSKQFSSLPPEAVQCIKDTIGEEGLQKLQSGEFDQDVDFSSLEGCFQQLQSSFGGGPGGPGGPGGFSGPGGCKSIEECTSYCQDNLEECQKFAPPGGGFPGGPGGGFPGGGGEQHDGFSECGIVPGAVAVPVCGVNGRGAQPGEEITYFNRCHAEQSGVQILHEGECKEQKCPGIADPVCGNDNISWTSSCAAEEHGGVKHKGVCTSEDFGGSGGGFSGPGGCSNPAECMSYCGEHYTDPACGGHGGGGSGGGTPTQSCAPLPSGLVSWSDDDTLSGGGVTLVPGKVGNALKFDGSGGHVTMVNPGNLNFGTGPFSLETWFNWGGKEGVNNIFRKSDYPVSGPGAGYWLRIGGNNLEFFTGETTGIDGGSRGIISTPINANAWYFVVATRDSSGDMKLYLNGQLKGTVKAAGANTTSEAPFTIGAWDDRFGVTELFSGLIDEATVYNRALNASEIQAIFNAGAAGKCTVESEPTNPPSYEQYQQSPAIPNYIQPSGTTGQGLPSQGGSTYEIPTTPELCAGFKEVPACSYVGASDSQNYQLCKKCYPNK